MVRFLLDQGADWSAKTGEGDTVLDVARRNGRDSVIKLLGIVRLQKRQIESELKVGQKERVPSRFDTRLWLYGLPDVCNLKPSDSNMEL